MKTKDILLLAGLGALALWYAKKQAIDATNAVLNLPGNVGTAIGNALYDWINPGDGVQEVYYTVTFPTGAKHAVVSTSIDSNGRFVFNGNAYLMKKDANGMNVAVYSPTG